METNDYMACIRTAIERTSPFVLAMDPEDAVAMFLLLHQVQLRLSEDDLGQCEKIILNRAKLNMGRILRSHDHLFGALDLLAEQWLDMTGEPEYMRVMATIAAKQPQIRVKPTWDDYRIALLAYALREQETWVHEQTGEEPFDPPSLDRLLADGMAQLESQEDDWAREQLQWFANLQDRSAKTYWENLLTEHSHGPA